MINERQALALKLTDKDPGDGRFLCLYMGRQNSSIRPYEGWRILDGILDKRAAETNQTHACNYSYEREPSEKDLREGIMNEGRHD